MMRTQGWRKRLSAYVNAMRAQSYQLGRQDCWLFVAGAVEAMTGVDHAKPHRGRYKSSKGALGVMKRAGASNMAEVAGLYLSERASTVEAQIGDVMAIPTDDAFGFSLGVLNGERIFVVTPTGIETRDRTEATRAFEV